MKKALAAAIVLMFCLNVTLSLLNREGEIQVSPPSTPILTGPLHSPIPDDPVPDETEAVPIFVSVPKFRDSEADTVYGDILSHSNKRPFGNSSGRATNAHETAHGIHSYLRNKYTRESGKKVNGFYCLEGRGVIIEEPGIRKSQINRFVPQNLRSYRYNLYLEQQRAWDDRPLYVYDEWVAYVLGGMTNVEDAQEGRHKGGWTDGVSGCLGFSIYAVATCMAVKEHDPEYWESNKQFRDFTIWMLHKSQETYKMGHRMEEFQWKDQDKLLNEFLTSTSAAPMREFIKEHLDGVWLDMEVSYGSGDIRRRVVSPKCNHCRMHNENHARKNVGKTR
jgi:hypothetical protein